MHKVSFLFYLLELYFLQKSLFLRNPTFVHISEGSFFAEYIFHNEEIRFDTINDIIGLCVWFIILEQVMSYPGESEAENGDIY